MKRYKAVVLGAGWRGKGHIQAFLANADRFELSAVCDMDAARMTKTLAELGVSLPVYADAEKMLAAEKPEVFCFATQPTVRLPLVKLGIRHGVRAIAYEKPMAISLGEAKEICEVCERAGVKQIVCHQHKYGAHWQKVRELVRSGQIGQVREIHATSRGWFYHYVTHLVDYTMWLMDYPQPQWIVGHIHGRTQLKTQHCSPDYVMGQVGFDNGARAIFECGPLAPSRGVSNFWYDAGATVLGSDGFAEVIVGAGWRARTKGAAEVAQDPSISLSEIGDTVPYIADLARWLDDEKQVHPCNGALAYRGFEVAMGMLQSGLERRMVLPPVSPTEPVAERVVRELPDSPVGAGGPS